MLSYTGHPLVDVGIATIVAFAGKREPAELVSGDLDAIADYMERNYPVDPLKSFLTVAFPNSGFTQPAYEKNPDKRRQYARKILRAYASGNAGPEGELCVFSGKPAAAVAFDIEDKLVPGRAFRQHIPLITGEGVINFHPYGQAGLPVSGEIILAIQALPLGCAKVNGRLLAVHAEDPALTYRFARAFLEQNRRAILTAQQARDKKLPEQPHRVATLLIDTLLRIEGEREMVDSPFPSSVTAYHFSNSGQGVDLNIYHLPIEITSFLQQVMTPLYKTAWEEIRARGWEIAETRRSRKAKAERDEEVQPHFNVVYEDLLKLPDNARQFVRRYFLRVPERTRLPGDPRSTYSVREEAHLVSWDLTELFLKKVVFMDDSRISHIRKLADQLAEYVWTENDRTFFHRFLTASRYDELRALLIRLSVAQMKKGQAPVVTFDAYVKVFEEGEELPFSDWRLAKDLILIRMVEQLYKLGWIQSHAAELPEPAVVDNPD